MGTMSYLTAYVMQNITELGTILSKLQVVERLFVVSQPSPFPDNILKDAFCRFGGLIDAHFMTGKKVDIN